MNKMYVYVLILTQEDELWSACKWGHMFGIDNRQSTSDKHNKHVNLGLNFEDILSYIKYVTYYLEQTTL
jgi:hypothetical protein